MSGRRRPSRFVTITYYNSSGAYPAPAGPSPPRLTARGCCCSTRMAGRAIKRKCGELCHRWAGRNHFTADISTLLPAAPPPQPPALTHSGRITHTQTMLVTLLLLLACGATTWAAPSPAPAPAPTPLFAPPPLRYRQDSLSPAISNETQGLHYGVLTKVGKGASIGRSPHSSP